MRKAWWLGMLSAVLILLAGCGGKHDQNSTDARAVNAVVDSEPLDVLVDGDVKVSGVAFGATSAFSEFPSGSHEVVVRSSTAQTIFVDKTIDLGSGANNTLLIYGPRTAMSLLVLVDDAPTNPTSGNFQLRGVGASADSGAVDIYLTPSTDISSAPVTIGAASFTTQSAFAQGLAGSYVLTFTVAGTKDILLQTAPQNLTAGTSYTLLVLPSGGGKLANGLLLAQGAGGAGTFLPNTFGRVKAVNAVPDSTALDLRADGTTALLSNVPFGASSSYVPLAAGTRTLQLQASNVPGTVIASLVQEVAPARDYTAVAVNSLAQARLVTFTDDNTLPAGGFAKLRFANVMVDSPGADVLLDFASQVSGLAFGTASAYYTVAPSLTYTITFATPGGVTVLATIAPVEIDAGAIYTAYLVGTVAAPQVRLVRDR